MKLIATLWACSLLPAFARAHELAVYPAPEGVALHPNFTVQVRLPGDEWRPVSVYVVKVDAVIGTTHSPRESSMAFFDFAGAVEVAVTFNRGPVQSARVPRVASTP